MSNGSDRSGVFTLSPQVDAIERQLRELTRPIAKVKQPSVEDQCKVRAKQEFRAELEACGLSNCAAAKLLRVTESCIRAWLDQQDLRRNPPSWATEALGEKAQIRRAQYAVDVLKLAANR
jgi:hypothetical protein